MKAYMQGNYGTTDTLQLVDINKPIPGDKEVLIKIKAVAVNSTDPTFLTGKPMIARLFTGLTKPKKRPGQDLSGIIEAIGKDVTRFRIGDAIYGPSDQTSGALAEYITLPEDGSIALKPVSSTYEEAAGICDGALTALPFIIDLGQISQGDRLLINGISGSIGLFALQYAKYIGAHVTGVCSNKNIDLVKSLGADEVIDYNTTDFTKNGKTYDIIFDTVAKLSYGKCKQSLSEKGLYLITFPAPSTLLKALFSSKSKGKRAGFVATGLRKSPLKINYLDYAAKLIDEGQIKPIIDQIHPFDDIAPAFNYVAKGHKVGNVVISMPK